MAEGFTSQQQAADFPPIAMQAKRMRLFGRVQGLNRDRAGPLLISSARLFGTVIGGLTNLGAQGAPALPPVDREAVRAVLIALSDIATGGPLEKSIEGLTVKVGDTSGSVRQASFNAVAEVPNGLLNASAAIRLEDMNLADAPPEVRNLVPHRVVLQLSVSGLSVAAFTKLAMAATKGTRNSRPSTQRSAIFSRKVRRLLPWTAWPLISDRPSSKPLESSPFRRRIACGAKRGLPRRG